MTSPFILLGLPYSGLCLGQKVFEALGINFGTVEQRDKIRETLNQSLESGGASLHGLDCRLSVGQLQQHFQHKEFEAAANAVRGDGAYWGLCGARLHLFLPEILALYPGARLFFMGRDPGVNRVEIEQQIAAMGLRVPSQADIANAQLEYMHLALRCNSDVRHSRIICLETILKQPMRLPVYFNTLRDYEDCQGLSVDVVQGVSMYDITVQHLEVYKEGYDSSRVQSLPALEACWFSMQQKSI